MASFDAQHITSPVQKALILRRLRDSRAQLTVTFLDSKRFYNSIIIAVDATAGTLDLDELHPARGHEAVQSGSRLRVETRLDGVETRFVVEVAEVLLSNGIYFYRAPFPNPLIYQQLRQFHRVQVKRSFAHRLSVGEHELDARLVDISAGGFCATLTDKKAKVAKGEEHECRLQIGEEEPISLKVQVRYTNETDRGQTRFGAMFLDLV